MATMEEKAKEKSKVFVGELINQRFSEEEMNVRREFYGRSGIEVFKIERRK